MRSTTTIVLLGIVLFVIMQYLFAFRTGSFNSVRNRQHRSFAASKSNTSGTTRITFRGKSFDAKVGQLLRTVLLKNGVTPHNAASKEICCRGIGTCGTCAVEIVKGSVEPVERSALEIARLNFPPHNKNNSADRLRLSCQIRIAETDTMNDIIVKKYTGFWGQNLEESNETADDFRLPLGKVEFILDRKKE